MFLWPVLDDSIFNRNKWRLTDKIESGKQMDCLLLSFHWILTIRKCQIMNAVRILMTSLNTRCSFDRSWHESSQLSEIHFQQSVLAQICPCSSQISLCTFSIVIRNWLNLNFFFFSTESNGSFNIKASSGYKFGCLAKIVNYMKVMRILGRTLKTFFCSAAPTQILRFYRFPQTV